MSIRIDLIISNLNGYGAVIGTETHYRPTVFVLMAAICRLYQVQQVVIDNTIVTA